MITSNEGKVIMKGRDVEVVADFGCIIKSIFECDKLDVDRLMDIMEYSVKAGMEEREHV